MIDTGGTLCAGADQLAAYGAKAIYALATHGVLSGPAIDRIKNSVLSKVIVTNTLPLPASKQIDKIEVLSIAKVLAETIDAVFEDKSVSEIFDGANQKRSEEHKSELQSLMRISYAVYCLKKKTP